MRFIFSTTAAVYGDPDNVPIDEAHPKLPINPCGRSKWMIEQALEDYDRAYGMKSVCLRYFNAAGTDPESELGDRYVPELHMIPLVLQAASSRRKAISEFGTFDDCCWRGFRCFGEFYINWCRGTRGSFSNISIPPTFNAIAFDCNGYCSNYPTGYLCWFGALDYG